MQAAVKRQCEIGLGIINDGEQSKTGFAQYIRERLHGFKGDPVPRVLSLEAREFPSGGTGDRTGQAAIVGGRCAACERRAKEALMMLSSQSLGASD